MLLPSSVRVREWLIVVWSVRAYVPSRDVAGRTALADVPEPAPGPEEALRRIRGNVVLTIA
jgi:hypothetical protein